MRSEGTIGRAISRRICGYGRTGDDFFDNDGPNGIAGLHLWEKILDDD
jgi:hypothetical protein